MGFREPATTSDRNNFAPRLGFAFLPFGGTRFVTQGRLRRLLRQGELEHAPGAEQPAAVPDVAAVPAAGHRSVRRSPASGTVPLPNVNAFQTDFRDAFYHQWNVFAEGEPLTDFTVGLGYVGSKGEICRYARLQPADAGTGAVQARRPIQQYATDQPGHLGHVVDLSLAAGAAERRFRRGLGFLTSYTLSKAIDTVPIYGGAAPDANNVDAARGPADTDSRHRFSASFNYELPFGPGRPFLGTPAGFTRRSSAAGRSTASSRSPRACRSRRSCRRTSPAPDAPAASGPTARAAARSTTRRRIAGSTPAASRPGGGHVRHGGPQHARRPRPSNVDLSVFKSSAFTTSHRLQFRAEIFNLFNHANFGQPNATIDAPLTVGRISSTSPIRVRFSSH